MVSTAFEDSNRISFPPQQATKQKPISANAIYRASLARWPRGLSRGDAAIYIGVSASKFDQLVADGRMPQPKRMDGRKVWDMKRLDQAFDDIDGDSESNPWDGAFAR